MLLYATNFQLVAEHVTLHGSPIPESRHQWHHATNDLDELQEYPAQPVGLPKDACNAGLIASDPNDGCQEGSKLNRGSSVNLLACSKRQILLFLIVVGIPVSLGTQGQDTVFSVPDFNEPNTVYTPMQQLPIDPGKQRNIT